MSSSLEDDTCNGIAKEYNLVRFILNENEDLKLAGVVFSVLMLIYIILSVSYFMYYRTSYYSLRKRNLIMLLFYASGLTVLTITVNVRLAIGGENFPCKALFVLALAFPLLLVIPTIARLLNVVLRIRFNESLINQSFNSVKNQTFKVKPGFELFVQSLEQNKPKISEDPIVGINDEYKHKEATWFLLNIAPLFYKIFCWSPPTNLPINLKFKLFLSLFRVLNVLITLVLFSLYITFVMIDENTIAILKNECVGCGGDYPLFEGGISIIGTVSVITFIVLIVFRKRVDGLRVKMELVISTVIMLVIGTIIGILFFIYIDYEEDGKFSWSLLLNFVTIGLIFVSFPYQVIQAKREYNNQTETTVTFDEILKDNNATRAFSLYLASKLSTETIFFYKAASNWVDLYEINTTNRNDEARNLLNIYLSYNGVFTINISYETRHELIENFKELQLRDVDLPKNTFDKAIVEQELLIIKNLAGFTKSIYYKAYLGNIEGEDVLEN